jgi:iron complex transport system substrate-binding protein
VKASVANALSVYEVLDDVLETLQPTHILTQTQCEVCAVSLRDVELSVARKLRSQPKIVSLEPNSLADIWSDMRRVADSVDIFASNNDAEPFIADLQQRLDNLKTLAHSDVRSPRVACIEWLEPLMAAGNWVPELVAMANAINLFGSAGRHSPWMTWQELVDADPDVIIVMPCGFSNARTLPEMHWIADRPEYSQLKAVRNRDVYVADGNQFFNRPGPRVVESLQILVEILHPGSSNRQFSNETYRRF